MAGPAASHDRDEEQPLDPAAERVRRKLVRFMGINLGILFAAVMAVVLALVYKTMTQPRGADAGQTTSQAEDIAGQVVLPQGARIVSHTASGDRLTLHVQLSDGSEAILVYDMGQGGRQAGRFDIVREAP